jgi:hypothetical protein
MESLNMRREGKKVVFGFYGNLVGLVFWGKLWDFKVWLKSFVELRQQFETKGKLSTSKERRKSQM